MNIGASIGREVKYLCDIMKKRTSTVPEQELRFSFASGALVISFRRLGSEATKICASQSSGLLFFKSAEGM